MSENNDLSKRESFETIIKSQTSLDRITYMKDLLSSMSSIICILNHTNQIVFYNENIIEKYGLNLETDILGIRPGEVFNCVNANNSSGGCGTTEKCQYCGAYNAFKNCWSEQKKIVSECRIVREGDTHTVQLDLEITATPFFHEEEYIIVSMQDITEKKRKELLERIFFHDVINIAGSLNGILQLLPTFSEDEKSEFLSIAGSLSSQIIDEIKAQQQLIQAESGELHINETIIETNTFLNKIIDYIRVNQVATGKKILSSDYTANARFLVDEVLLTRVLTNMTKNALEAIQRGQEITIATKLVSDNIRFEVTNPTFMTEEVQFQMFQRSFSTKGTNRGLGTYSMKLLGERYLNGHVGFESNTETGTTFFIELPFKLQVPDK